MYTDLSGINHVIMFYPMVPLPKWSVISTIYCSFIKQWHKMRSGLRGIRSAFQQVVISVALSLIRPHEPVFVAKPLWSGETGWENTLAQRDYVNLLDSWMWAVCEASVLNSHYSWLPLRQGVRPGCRAIVDHPRLLLISVLGFNWV